jgi:RNA polymerase sigma factor (sigma-70 family)
LTTDPIYPDDLNGNLQERLLLQKISQGDWEAYAQIFNHYLPKLSQYLHPFGGGSKDNTEEAIQEVFLKIWEKRDTLLAIRSFDSYLFRMAKNKLLDLLDKRKGIQSLHRGYAATRDSFHTAPEQSLIYADYHATAQKAIDQLSPKLQQVFLLHTQEELSLDEIAGQLDLPKETVKKRLYLANTAIKNYLRTHAEWVLVWTSFFFLNKK